MKFITKTKKYHKWDKVFKNGANKICGRQPLKHVTWFNFEYFIPYVIG